jgi:hypothetical protein
MAAAVRRSDWRRACDAFVQCTVLVEPPLLASLVLLMRRADAAPAALLDHVRVCSRGACAGVRDARNGLGGHRRPPVARSVFARRPPCWCLPTSPAPARHSPALAEARLQALQARIRPHFLFNSLKRCWR